MMGLAPKQKQIYDYIVEYMENNGFAPSYREIQDAMGYKSISTVFQELDAIEKKGFIERPIPGSPRAILVVGMKIFI